MQVQTVTGNVVFGALVQILDVGGNVTVVSQQPPPYRVLSADERPVPVSVGRARAQPSRLLLARHQIVPFSGRQRTLDSLAAWSAGEEPVAARLIHAAGGQGKTRLAGHVGGLAAAAGWAVWQATYTPTPVPGSGTSPSLGADAAGVSQVAVPSGAVLVVVDYADRWPVSALLALFIHMRDLHQAVRVRVRILLLARSDGYWWPAVADRADSDLGVDVDQMMLPALADDGHNDRPGLFTTAADRFAAVMDLPVPAGGWPTPPLSDSRYGQVLAVHMAALAAVDAHRHGDQAPTDPAAVSAYLLQREQAYWLQLHIRAEVPVRTRPELMHRVVFTATLTGTVPRTTAGQALACAGFIDTENPADRVIDDHTVCYPPADACTVFEPIHPDRLGEDLIALSIPGAQNTESRLARDWAPETVTRLLTSLPQPSGWTSAVVTVLIEAARRWPHLQDRLNAVLAQQPSLALTTGTAALVRLAGLSGIDPHVLSAIEEAAPPHHVDLDVGLAALARRLLTLRDEPARRARRQCRLALRLVNVGQYELAIDPVSAATAALRPMAEADPAAYRPDLAMALSTLVVCLSKLGRGEEALQAAEEATVHCLDLAEAHSISYLPPFVRSLHNLGTVLGELGQHERALGVMEKAVEGFQKLNEVDATTYRVDLARSLNTLVYCLCSMGRRGDALGPADEATTIFRELADSDPTAHLPSLADSLNNSSLNLSQMGLHERAVAPAEEATKIRRQLADINPDAYMPSFAGSLANLSMVWSLRNEPVRALGAAEEAVEIHRQLMLGGTHTHIPDFVMALNNLGNCLARVGKYEDALAATEDAVNRCRELVRGGSAGHRPNLALSLHNLCNRLSQLDRHNEAVTAAEESVQIRRELVLVSPMANLPDLAAALTQLRRELWLIDRHREALIPAEEAVDIYRRLANIDPDFHLSNLTMAYTSYAAMCMVTGVDPLTAFAWLMTPPIP